MKPPEKALFLNGSPKRSGSTSESIGNYLLAQLKGISAQSMHVNSALASDEGRKNLIVAANDADLLVIVFPLYIDSLPAGLMKCLELLGERLGSRSGDNPGEKRMLAICQNGFPEAYQNHTALAICRRFAERTGITWAGGIALGGGGSIGGKPLDKTGGMMYSFRKALDIAAENLSNGDPLSEEAVALAAKPYCPNWMYILGGHLGWKLQARKNKVSKRLNDRPLVDRIIE